MHARHPWTPPRDVTTAWGVSHAAFVSLAAVTRFVRRRRLAGGVWVALARAVVVGVGVGVGVGAVGVGGGCAARHTAAPYSTQTADQRDPRKADELNARAADLIDRDPLKAEALLREALTADLYHGPAHNNLGAIYLAQGKLYEAAAEFEWARKLLPGHPDPRMNLALTLETAGRTDEAMATYETALEVYPRHLPSTQALARLRVRAGQVDDRTKELLQEVAFRSEDARWRDWARVHLAKAPPR